MDLHEAAAELRATYLAFRSLWTAGTPRAAAGLGGRFALLTEPAYARRRAMAARIAGAATLLVLEDREEAKTALRSGACDFLVSGLDEALRILKNEIRRGAPVAVCLSGSPAGTLSECVERGVQPDLLDAPHDTLQQRGALCVMWQTRLAQGERSVCWHCADGPLQRIAELDRALEHALVAATPERRQWLKGSPGVLGRPWQRYRFLPMSEVELARSSPVLPTAVAQVVTGLAT